MPRRIGWDSASARRFYVRHGFAAIGVEDSEVTYSWPR
ncbi:hypothetical protein ABH927_004135 [Planotetraspora sp. GP83]